MSKKGSGAGGGGLQRDEGLQAVILADSLAAEFQPLVLDSPMSLLPVCGTAALEYTLELLAQQDVTEIIVFVTRHVAALKQYLAQSRWAKHVAADDAAAAAAATEEPRLRLVCSPGAQNAGDALRQLDDMGVLHSDAVVLVDGLVVGNVGLKAALAGHAERVKADSNTILTVVMTKNSGGGGGLHRETRVAVDAADGLLLSYDTVPPTERTTQRRGGKTWPATVTHRTDLVDSHVYICSPEVFIHFSDNYDYQDFRAHYLHNEVANVDMGFKFYVHIAADAYVRPLSSLHAFAAVTADVAQRRAFPFVPDANWSAPPLDALPPWRLTPSGAWVQAGASVATDATLGPGCVVFSGASIGARAAVSGGSVVHGGAAVSAGAQVSGSVLLPEAAVGTGASVEASVLGRGAAVGAEARIHRGCVLGVGVTVSAGASVPAFLWCSSAPLPPDGAFSSSFPIQGGGAVSSVAGVSGRLWPLEDELVDLAQGGVDDDDDEDGTETGDSGAGAFGVQQSAVIEALLGKLRAALVSQRRHMDGVEVENGSGVDRASEQTIAALAAQVLRQPFASRRTALPELDAAMPLLRAAVARGDALEASPSARGGASAVAAVAASGSAGVAGASSTGAGPCSGPAWAAFAAGVRDLLAPALAAFTRAGPGAALSEAEVRNAALEIKSFKYAENRGFGDCLAAMIPLILGAVRRPAASSSESALFGAAKSVLTAWAPLLAIFSTTPDDELAAITAVEAFVLDPHNAAFAPIFGLLVQALLDLEVLSDVSVTAWVDGCEGRGAEVRALLESKWMQKVIELIDQESEEEDEEEEEDGDECDGAGSGDA